MSISSPDAPARSHACRASSVLLLAASTAVRTWSRSTASPQCRHGEILGHTRDRLVAPPRCRRHPTPGHGTRHRGETRYAHGPGRTGRRAERRRRRTAARCPASPRRATTGPAPITLRGTYAATARRAGKRLRLVHAGGAIELHLPAAGYRVRAILRPTARGASRRRGRGPRGVGAHDHRAFVASAASTRGRACSLLHPVMDRNGPVPLLTGSDEPRKEPPWVSRSFGPLLGEVSTRCQPKG
jgi:hypothetical protein